MTSTQMEQRHHRSEAFDREGLVTVGSQSVCLQLRLRSWSDRDEGSTNIFDEPLFKAGA